MTRLSDAPFDLIVTVSGHADDNCPAFNPQTKVVYVGFDEQILRWLVEEGLR